MSAKGASNEALATSSRLPTAKLTAVARFKSFTGSLVSKRESKRPKLRFPPPSWNIEDYPTSTASSTPPLTREPSSQGDDAHAAGPSTTPTPEEPEPEVEPVTFARRLRSMIEMLPIPAMTGSPAATPAAEGSAPVLPTTPAEQQATPPVPPGIDPKLVEMLSSEGIMNGDAGIGGKDKKPSMWSILAGLRRNDKTSGKDDACAQSIALSVEEEDGGIMMYAPLEPRSDSLVCLAEAEVVQTPPDPHTCAKDKLQVVLDRSTAAGPSQPTVPAAPVEKRVWVPSTTELSVLTAWWGYRLYLPPPVMAKLGASSVKAAARAAMVTGALKWMLDKIPTAMVPVQFKPAVSLLKTLAPMAGFVGVFIAWSWDRIRALDDGNGVVLTATWLLPVALLPMAWDAGTIYQPILMPEPEEILKAEEAARAAEEAEANKNGSANEGEGKDKKKNKSKFRFW